MNRDINKRSWLSQDELQERISKYSEEQRFWEMIPVLSEDIITPKRVIKHIKYNHKLWKQLYEDNGKEYEVVRGMNDDLILKRY